MVNENQAKTQLVNYIKKLEQKAARYGFDLPYESVEMASYAELLEYFYELSDFIGYEQGYIEAKRVYSR